MLYSDDDGRQDYPCSEKERRNEIRNKWINERVQKLMYDPDWLYQIDMSEWDDENYQNLIHLPILLV